MPRKKKWELPKGASVLSEEAGLHPRWGTPLADVTVITYEDANGQKVDANGLQLKVSGCNWCRRTWPKPGSAFSHLSKCEIRRELVPPKKKKAASSTVAAPLRPKKAETIKPKGDEAPAVAVEVSPGVAAEVPSTNGKPDIEAALQSLDSVETTLATLEEALSEARSDAEHYKAKYEALWLSVVELAKSAS